MRSIVTLTMNPSIDTNSSVERVIAEQKLRCLPPRDDPGGGGLNVSRAVKKLGGDSSAFYTVGGLLGEKLKSLLDREQLDHVPIPVRDSTRQDLIILDDGTGQQYRFQMPGPKIEDSELETCCKMLSQITPTPQYLVASGSLPPGVPEDFYAGVGELAHELGALFIVDTSGTPLLHALRAGVYLLKPNLRELQVLAQHKIEDEAQIEEAAANILNTGKVEVLVISMGAGGAILATREGCEHMRAPMVPIQSKVGAGDSMVGGLVLKLLQGESLRNAVLYGVAAGAAAVMTPGTQLCRREDTDRLYERMLSRKYA